MPFKHAHPINLEVGEQHHVDVAGNRFGHERHVQAATVPGVTSGAVVAHTHHDVEERIDDGPGGTGLTSHHLISARKAVRTDHVKADFDADLLDDEERPVAAMTAAAPVSPRRRDLDNE